MLWHRRQHQRQHQRVGIGVGVGVGVGVSVGIRVGISVSIGVSISISISIVSVTSRDSFGSTTPGSVSASVVGCTTGCEVEEKRKTNCKTSHDVTLVR